MVLDALFLANHWEELERNGLLEKFLEKLPREKLETNDREVIRDLVDKANQNDIQKYKEQVAYA